MALQVFSDWKAAHTAAQADANRLGLSLGIEKAKEYGKTVFRVSILPKPENRYGWETRCEVVDPDLPQS